VTITCLRPIASESGPVNSRPTASIAVEIDSETLLLAGVTPNSAEYRQNRLDAVEQGEGGQTGGEEGESDPHKLGVPRLIN
jgi:hypothetical protein